MWRVFATVLLTAAIILAPQAALAACGFSGNGDYICDGGGNEAKGKTKPARSFTAPKTTKPSPGTYKPLPGMGGSGIDYQAELKKIKDQIEADKKRLEDAMKAPPHGGGSGCAQPGVPGGNGTTYYVAANGNDSGSCTQAQPCGSINAGIARLKPGDTLVIKPGTYAEHINSGDIPNGTSSAFTTIKAETPGTVTLRPATGTTYGRGDVISLLSQSYIHFDGLVLDGSNVRGNVVMVWYKNSRAPESHHITFSNMEIKNAPSGGCLYAGGGANSLPHHIQVLNSKLHDCALRDAGNRKGGVGHGLYLMGSDNIVDGNEIYNNAGLGIQQYRDQNASDGRTRNSNNIIRNNYVHDNGKTGLLMGFGDNNVAYNNLIANNGHGTGNSDGIGIGGSPNNTQVYDNIISGNAGECVGIGSGKNTSVRNNGCWKNGHDGVLDKGTGSVINNPVLTSAPSLGGVGPAAGCP